MNFQKFLFIFFAGILLAGMVCMRAQQMSVRVAGPEAKHSEPQEEIPALAPLIKWVSIQRASTLSKTAHKPILFLFTASGCAPCKRMEDELLDDKKSAEIINDKFVPVLIYCPQMKARNPLEYQLIRAYHIFVFPSLVISDADGNLKSAKMGYTDKADSTIFLDAPAKPQAN